LDKDNLLTDHPQKYLLYEAGKDTPDMPPPIILPIPNTYNAILTQNKRITPLDHWQDVRHLKLTVKIESENAIPELLPGSTLIIYPKNYPEDAQKLIDLMGWASVADKPIDWPDRNTTSDSLSNPPKRSDPKLSGLGHPPSNLHYLRNSTLRDLLIHNLDITSVPNRTFIKRLAHFTKDEREKERLLELTHADGTQEFYDYTSRPRRTILEVLEDFKNVKIPLDYLLELIPVIRGREFSIANGGLSLKGASGPELITVELIVALVEYKTIIRKPRQGLCSRYIRWLFEDTLIGVSIKTGNPPPCSGRSAKRPLIAIATGTGIAPVRSLIHERDMYNDEEQPVGPQLLFFGCRNRAADFYFADEWARRGVEVRPAFSRDPGAALEAGVTLAPPTGLSLTSGDLAEAAALGVGASAQWLASDYDRGKNYVQHVIRRHAARVCELLRRDAVVVLCGNSGRMPVSVRAALLDALVLGGLAKDKDEAEAFFAEVSFWQETW
jgi:sulfite reductase alpha subunit-like flavoprotein